MKIHSQQTNQSKFTPSPRRWAVVSAAIVLILSLFVWRQANQWYQATLLTNQRSQIEDNLIPYGNALTSVLNRRFTLLEGLASFVKIHPTNADLRSEFTPFASGLYVGQQDIRAIQIFPKDGAVFVYPIEGNEATIGRTLDNLINDDRPDVRADIQRAIQTRQIAISGPYELRQGGMGLVARLAIYREDTLLGIAVIILDIPPLLEASGLANPQPHIRLALKDLSGQILTGSGDVFSDNPVTYTIVLPDGEWELAAMPPDGWTASIQNSLRIFQWTGLLVIALATSLAYLITNRQARLTLAVQEQTASLTVSIDKREQANEALRASEDRYRDLVENSSDLICTHDLEGKLLSVNEAALRLTGYSRADLLQMNMLDLISPDMRRFFSAYLKKVRTAGHARGLIQIQTTSGENRIWEYDNTLRTEGMAVPIVRGMAHDITERKRAEEKLRESQMQLEGIFNSTMDAIITIDEEQKIIIFNPAAEHMFRCPASEVIGQTFDRFLPEYIRKKHKGYLRSFGQSNSTKRSTQTPSLALTGLRANGEAFPSEVSISKLDLGGKKLYTAIVRDITERKRAEEKLRQSEERYRSLFEQTHDAVFILDLMGNHISANQRAADMLGYTLAEIQKLSFRDISAEISQSENLMKRLVADEQIPPYERLFRKKNGEVLPVEINVGLVRDTKGNPQYIQSAVRDITERKQAEKKIRRQIDYLTALQDIDRIIASAFDMRQSLNTLIAKAVSLLSVDAAAVLLINFDMNTLEFAAGDGFRTNAVKTANVKLGESYAGRAAIEKHIIKFPSPKDEPGNLFLTGFLKEEEFVSYYGVPLIVKENVIGVLEVFHRSLIKRDQEWLDFLNALAGQAAIAISNAQLFDNLQHSNNEIIQAYDATIEGWSRAMDLRDKETEGHTLRVTEMTMRLASLMHISDAEQAHIRRGALLHDIGKLGVPDSILHKPDQLTDEEWGIMRQHPTHAYEMLSSINYLKPALDIPYCHHEKWDGTGYPRGLKGEQIPLVARIFAVVDVWDALRSDRPYRAGWPQEKVIEYIRAEAGKHLDPEVAKVFLNMIAGK